jgi:hypothetical protein
MIQYVGSDEGVIRLRVTRLRRTRITWGGLEKTVDARCDLSEQDARALAANTSGLPTAEVESTVWEEEMILSITAPDRNASTRVYGINLTHQQEQVTIEWPRGQWRQEIDWIEEAGVVTGQITNIVRGASLCTVQQSEIKIALVPMQRITVGTPSGECEIEQRWSASDGEICQTARTSMLMAPHGPVGPTTPRLSTVLLEWLFSLSESDQEGIRCGRGRPTTTTPPGALRSAKATKAATQVLRTQAWRQLTESDSE